MLASGDLHALLQRDELVGVPRHHHLIVAGAQQGGAQFTGGFEGEILLGRPLGRRAGILSAVAGVDHDDPRDVRGRSLDGESGLRLRGLRDRRRRRRRGAGRLGRSRGAARGRGEINDIAIDRDAVVRRQQEAALHHPGRGERDI